MPHTPADVVGLCPVPKVSLDGFRLGLDAARGARARPGSEREQAEGRIPPKKNKAGSRGTTVSLRAAWNGGPPEGFQWGIRLGGHRREGGDPRSALPSLVQVRPPVLNSKPEPPAENAHRGRGLPHQRGNFPKTPGWTVPLTPDPKKDQFGQPLSSAVTKNFFIFHSSHIPPLSPKGGYANCEIGTCNLHRMHTPPLLKGRGIRTVKMPYMCILNININLCIFIYGLYTHTYIHTYVYTYIFTHIYYIMYIMYIIYLYNIYVRVYKCAGAVFSSLSR